MGIILFDMVLFGILIGVTGTLLLLESIDIIRDFKSEKKQYENRERVWKNFVNMGK